MLSNLGSVGTHVGPPLPPAVRRHQKLDWPPASRPVFRERSTLGVRRRGHRGRDALKAVGEDTQVTDERQQSLKKATTIMEKRMVGSTEGEGGDSPSRLIDARIRELSDWRGETLARVRILIKQADPEVVEEWKWRGVPVWWHAGMICTGETYKNVVKMTFAKGASLEDPSGLFNSSLEGSTRRAIDFHEGDKIDEKALKVLIRAAVALNASSAG